MVITTYPVIRNLLDEHKLTAVGTLRKNKREISLKFLNVKKDRRSSMFGFSNKITLVSYVPDSKKRKNIVFFSSMHLGDKN